MEEISLCPELSSPFRFRIQGGGLSIIYTLYYTLECVHYLHCDLKSRETEVNYVQYVVCVSWKFVNYSTLTFLCWSIILSFQYDSTTTWLLGVA